MCIYQVKYLVGAKVSELEVKVVIQDTVLRFDISVEHTPLVQVHHCQQGLDEIVAGQGLRKTTHSAEIIESNL